MNSKSVISFKNASIFQRDRCVLKDVNFDIEEGEFVYLIRQSHQESRKNHIFQKRRLFILENLILAKHFKQLSSPPQSS